ncbi:SpoIIE family protein phosphatase [Aeromicrobium fastidiosum]|uniref:SpoIIE family protein phosphatase n=1 Tax=Aeromicrobium fastidiosum TaxID=52699 RepID=UPI0020232FFB|nr:SpoIIE family protein phosphatase [Aeromicrobium fastidiosum]MCL8250794.1 SpoIIE family protein phosphatase [Aeromicrobium fastidiosum]
MQRDLFSAAGGLRPGLDQVDWASTPLGAVDTWSPTLRGTVDLMMHSKFPMTLLWGPSFVVLYNEAYVELIGDKHPAAIGAPAEVVFAEAWPQIAPMMQGVAETGEALLVEHALVPLERHGFLEDCYFTFSYSAVRGSDGTIEGVIDVVTETTRQVQGQRRVELLARLSEELADVADADDVRARALQVLRGGSDELEVVDIREATVDEHGRTTGLPDAPDEPLDGEHVVVQTLDDGARIAWAVAGATRAGVEPFVLVLRLAPRVRVDRDLRDTIRLAASIVGRALGRARTEQAERAHRELEAQLSETLQRSLLSRPVQRDDVQVAVRYVPASTEAQVGGDWYDAFALPHGDLAVVIGDVTGHDRDAAAMMAQLRNLTRGVSMTARQTPAEVLSSLEGAVTGLQLDVLATAVVAHLADAADDGAMTFGWSNAGHPPPVLVSPDGVATVLHRKADVLLGLLAAERVDHHVVAPVGSTVVLYTDGLIERRDHDLDDGFAWLEQVLADTQHLDLEQVCELLLAQMPGTVDDDVALLVLRTGPVPR